tara:strand:- start:1827 stop:2093 length:267 start_codon:yes stop_codon:yes gene_type:complete
VIDMTWKDKIQKKMPKGELLGGMGMRITVDSLTAKERLYKRIKSDEAQTLADFLQEARITALELMSKINDANKYYEENKDALDRKKGD